jgi:DNA-binding HxlR family transcriptional regulator
MNLYNQYCPVARAAYVVADRWTPLILRELFAGSAHFNDFQRGLPGISRTLLSQRLRLLEDKGVIHRECTASGRTSSYCLTSAGMELGALIRDLGRWGARWVMDDPDDSELKSELLGWFIHQRINRPQLPPGRTVVEFQFLGARHPWQWMILKREEVEVCLEHPGFDVDLRVKADLATFYKVWAGNMEYSQAVSLGKIKVLGPPVLIRAFPTWLKWSPMAPVVRARLAEISQGL